MAKKKVKTKKLKTYHVPVCVIVSSHITVKAKNKREAIEKAQSKYPGLNRLESPCVDVDICQIEEDVELDEGEDDV